MTTLITDISISIGVKYSKKELNGLYGESKCKLELSARTTFGNIVNEVSDKLGIAKQIAHAWNDGTKSTFTNHLSTGVSYITDTVDSIKNKNKVIIEDVRSEGAWATIQKITGRFMREKSTSMIIGSESTALLTAEAPWVDRPTFKMPEFTPLFDSLKTKTASIQSFFPKIANVIPTMQLPNIPAIKLPVIPNFELPSIPGIPLTEILMSEPAQKGAEFILDKIIEIGVDKLQEQLERPMDERVEEIETKAMEILRNNFVEESGELLDAAKIIVNHKTTSCQDCLHRGISRLKEGISKIVKCASIGIAKCCARSLQSSLNRLI